MLAIRLSWSLIICESIIANQSKNGSQWTPIPLKSFIYPHIHRNWTLTSTWTVIWKVQYMETSVVFLGQKMLFAKRLFRMWEGYKKCIEKLRNSSIILMSSMQKINTFNCRRNILIANWNKSADKLCREAINRYSGQCIIPQSESHVAYAEGTGAKRTETLFSATL